MQFSSTISNTKKAFSEFLYVEEDHLGNVRAVISDVLKPADTNTDDVLDQVTASVVSADDYLPYHQIMPGRNFSSNEYRYGGASGHEKDNEISGGNGNHYTADYWEYDSRTGRRWNLDPLASDYAWQSPYSTFNDSPIQIADKKGAGGVVTSVKKNEETGKDEATISATIFIYKKKDENVDLEKFKSTLEESLNRQLNSANGTVQVIDPKTKREITAVAKFDIKVQVLEGTPEQIAEKVKSNTRYANNYFGVYTNPDPGSTNETAVGGNSGFFQTNTNENTWAHEFLHDLGWGSANSDNPKAYGSHSKDINSIMYHNPSATATVSAQDVSNLNYLNGVLSQRMGLGWKVTNNIFNAPDRTPIKTTK